MNSFWRFIPSFEGKTVIILMPLEGALFIRLNSNFSIGGNGGVKNKMLKNILILMGKYIFYKYITESNIPKFTLIG